MKDEEPSELDHVIGRDNPDAAKTFSVSEDYSNQVPHASVPALWYCGCYK